MNSQKCWNKNIWEYHNENNENADIYPYELLKQWYTRLYSLQKYFFEAAMARKAVIFGGADAIRIGYGGQKKVLPAARIV